MLILGLGCNIGDRLANLREALRQLEQIEQLKINQVSPVYQSDALLTPDAPLTWNQPFLNAAVSCYSELPPQQLLVKLKAIEKNMGRASNAKWSPRIIDIDILAWGDLEIHTDKLAIPHSELINRPFALWPLTDLNPNWKFCVKNSTEYLKPAVSIVKKWGSRFDAKAPLHTVQIGHRIDTPFMMGILNITPDSFSDGGKFNQVSDATKQAEILFTSGADIIDIGAESTRPQAVTLTPDEEWRRLEPVLKEIQSLWKNSTFKPKISIDTRNPETALKAIEHEIDFLNDVTGFTNPKMLKVAKKTSAQLIFMHNLGVPPSSEIIIPESENAVNFVYSWALKQLDQFDKHGISRERLIFDIGIGFGKSKEQSFELIQSIAMFHKLGIKLLVGHSRKSFLSKYNTKPATERDLETAIFSNYLSNQKVHYLRVHNVEANLTALKINASLGCSK